MNRKAHFFFQLNGPHFSLTCAIRASLTKKALVKHTLWLLRYGVISCIYNQISKAKEEEQLNIWLLLLTRAILITVCFWPNAGTSNLPCIWIQFARSIEDCCCSTIWLCEQNKCQIFCFLNHTIIPQIFKAKIFQSKTVSQTSNEIFLL